MSESLQKLYKEQVAEDLKSQFNYKNCHEIPKVIKITINRGLGIASQNTKALESSVNELAIISGQKPIVTRSKNAIAGFKIRDGVPVGICVTLRKAKMYSFLQRLIHLALPRIRDFRGISPRGFDGNGNFNLGIKEQLIFPEIQYNEVEKIMGLDISIVTTAQTDAEALALLKGLGFPFQKKS